MPRCPSLHLSATATSLSLVALSKIAQPFTISSAIQRLATPSAALAILTIIRIAVKRVLLLTRGKPSMQDMRADGAKSAQHRRLLTGSMISSLLAGLIMDLLGNTLVSWIGTTLIVVTLIADFIFFK